MALPATQVAVSTIGTAGHLSCQVTQASQVLQAGKAVGLKKRDKVSRDALRNEHQMGPLFALVQNAQMPACHGLLECQLSMCSTAMICICVGCVCIFM